MSNDALEFLPLNRWHELKQALKADFPRSISGFKTLETEEYMLSVGVDYGFKVYCPFGDVNNGMVAINKKGTFYEVVIECPNDTRKLEEALMATKIIDWSGKTAVPFAPQHIVEVLKRVAAIKNLKTDYMITTETFMLDTQIPFHISLPEGLTFEQIPLEYVKLVDSTYPYRRSNTEWFFELLTKAKLGYGLFKGKELMSWAYIRETGPLGHLFTLENHRRKGYGELVLKLISNVLIQQGQTVLAFCVVGNLSARMLYIKLGFTSGQDVVWCGFNGGT